VPWTRGFLRTVPPAAADVRPPRGFCGLDLGALEPRSRVTPERLAEKIAERFAFERAQIGLYAALLAKLDACGPIAGGPRRADLFWILAEERRHVMLLVEAMAVLDAGHHEVVSLPPAGLTTTVAQTVSRLLNHPDATFLSALEAMLVAEFADRNGWHELAELAGHARVPELQRQFEEAERTETRHVRCLWDWIRRSGVVPTEQARQEGDWGSPV